MEEQKDEDNYIMRSFIMFTLYHRSIMSFTYIAYLTEYCGYLRLYALNER